MTESFVPETTSPGAPPGVHQVPSPAEAWPAPAVPQPMRRAPIHYQPAEAGWWLATDGLWYPPETAPGSTPQWAPAGPGYGVPVVNKPAAGSQNVVVQVVPPGYGQHPYPYGYGGAPAFVSGPPKSRVAAGLLGIFLGGLGIHRFYLGSSGLGVLMLLISVLSLFILAPFVALWGFIEGVVILCGGIKTDARGRPLE